MASFSSADYALYGPTSTDSELGYRAGNYLNPRSLNVGYGIPIATPLAYVVKAHRAGNLFPTNVNVNSEGFLQLSNLPADATLAKQVDNALVLSSPRAIIILSESSAFNVNVSMYDAYGRQMTASGESVEESEGNFTLHMGRIPASIVSVQFTGVDVSTFTANIYVTYQFSLPFNNFGIDSLLRTVNYENYQVFQPIVGESTPYFAKYYHIGSPNPAVPQNSNSGISVPFIDLTDVMAILQNIKVDGTLVMEQALPVDQSVITPPFQEVSNPLYPIMGFQLADFIGETPYNVNWRGWNG